VKKLVWASILVLGAAAHAAAPGQMLNLSCVEALVSVGRPELAGVFSFVAEKDAPAAFADLLAHDKKAFKKFVSKLEGDYKTAQSLTAWDHEAAAALVALYGSPLGETLEKPKPAVIQRLAELTAAPSIPLEQMTARRRK
jgi:hypothetical protein